MITTKELRRIAEARLKDAAAPLGARRYDGAVYLCGYAVELALKARICHTLRWAGYPASNSEFKEYQSFRVHDLDVLLHLTGRENTVKTSHFAEWSAVAEWNPSARYQAIGTAKRSDAELMITSARTLLRKI